MSRLNWARFDGAEFESLVHSVLFFKEPNVILLGRPGKDSGQDAVSADGTHVYQAKYGRTLTMADAISRAKDELAKIKKYRKTGNQNYSVWAKVKRWTLVANFTKNRLDVQKWEREVVRSFKGIGVEADFIDATDLENELLGFPDIEHAYFEGKNRAFAGMWEVRRFLEQERRGEYYFATEMFGRDAARRRLLDMMGDAKRRFVVVHGEAEVGKTRFLYETACDLSEQGWRVLWGLSESMALSDSWMNGIGGSCDKTCMIVDAPKDRALIQAIYEQLSLAGKSTWKVILSCQPSEYNDWFARDCCREDTSDITLDVLTLDETKGLVRAFADYCKMGLQRRAAEGLYSLTRGIPGWMNWILSFSAENKKCLYIDSELLKAVGLHVKKTIAKCEPSRRDLVLNVFRWICAWKTIVVDSGESSNAVIEFLSAELGAAPRDVCEALQCLAEKGLVSLWGHNRKIYMAEPSLIRHEVLSEWLFSGTGPAYHVSVEGAKFIEKILKKDMPGKETVVENLARLSSCYLGEENGASFVSPIIQELKAEAERGGVVQQLAVMEWIKRLAPVDPESALDVLCVCWDHPKASCVVKHRYWGEQTFNHAQLLAEIPWFLYSLTELQLSLVAAKKLWTCFKRIYNEEKDGKFSAVSGQGAGELIERLLVELRGGDLFKEYAFKDLMADCQRGEFSVFDIVLAKGALASRMESTEAFGRQFTFSHAYLMPGQPGWERSLKTRETLFGLLKDNRIPAMAPAIWRVLSDAHYGWRASEMLDSQASTILKADYDPIVLGDLKNTLDILKSRKSSISHAELGAARHLWVTALKYGKSDEEIALAQSCEKECAKHFKWSFVDFFSWDLGEEDLKSKVGQIKSRFRDAATAEEIVNYFNEALEFLKARDPEHPDADCGRSCDLAIACQDLYVAGGNDSYSSFLEKKLPELMSENPFAESFAECFVRMRIRDFRAHFPTLSVAEELERLMGRAKNKGTFLCRVYEGRSSKSIGRVTAKELDYIDASKCVMSDYEYVRVLPTFLSIDQDGISTRFREVLAVSAQDHKRLEELWWAFAFNCYLVVLREGEEGVICPIKLLMATFTEYDINGSRLGDHHLAHLAKMTKFKFSRGEFCALLKRRIELEKRERLCDGYEVMPHGFNVGEWVSEEPDVQAVMEICRMSVEERTFLASYRIPEYLVALDAAGNTVGEFVERYINEHAPVDKLRLYCLGCLCSAYEEGSPSWRKIATPICHYMNETGVGREDRYSVYAAFQPRMHTWTSAAGEVPAVFIDKEAAARKAVESESRDSDLYEFFVWSHNCADWALKSERDRVEVVRHE